MECRDLREIADSYLSDELLIETNHEVIRHLESCADCRRELAARRALQAKLRSAFNNAPEMGMRDEFAEQLRTQLRAHAKRRSFLGGYRERGLWLGLAACLVVAVLFDVRAFRQSWSQTTAVQTVGANRDDQSQFGPASSTAQVPLVSADDSTDQAHRALVRLGEVVAGDHQDCAVKFRLPKKPIDLEDAGRRYDRAYLNLTDAMMRGQSDAPERVQLVKAHSCVFGDQRFGHLILKYHGQLISVLVTNLNPKNLSTQTTGSPGNRNGTVAACPQVAGYRIACFKTEHHGVFVVSDLTEKENLAITRTLAPSIYEHITQVENIA